MRSPKRQSLTTAYVRDFHPPPYLNKARILLVDIETLPALGFFWDRPWETSIIEVVKEWQILSFSAKWLGGEQETHINHKTDKFLVKKLWNLLDNSDIVIGQNLDRFDIRKINSRFLFYNLPPPSPYKTVDTLKVARKNFALLSNKQDDLGKYLKIGGKIKVDKGLWLGCIKGDKKALKRMAKYNAHDVKMLEKIYLRFQPWLKLNLGMFSASTCCPKCGSKKLQRRGFTCNATTQYQKIQCQSCFGWSRTSLNLRETKPLISL